MIRALGRFALHCSSIGAQAEHSTVWYGAGLQSIALQASAHVVQIGVRQKEALHSFKLHIGSTASRGIVIRGRRIRLRCTCTQQTL